MNYEITTRAYKARRQSVIERNTRDYIKSERSKNFIAVLAFAAAWATILSLYTYNV